MNRVPQHVRRSVTVALAVLAAAWGLVALAGPAAAHGGAGTLEVLSSEPQPDGASVNVTVRLTFAGDGDPAADATVTVVGEREGDAGADFTPVTLTPGGPAGQYAGVVPLPAPGNWTLRVTSVEPPATATTQVSVAGASLTVETSAAPSTSPTTTAAAPSTGGSDDDGPNLAVRSAIVGGVVGALAAFMVGARRRKAAQSAGATGDRPDAD